MPDLLKVGDEVVRTSSHFSSQPEVIKIERLTPTTYVTSNREKFRRGKDPDCSNYGCSRVGSYGDAVSIHKMTDEWKTVLAKQAETNRRKFYWRKLSDIDYRDLPESVTADRLKEIYKELLKGEK